MASVFGVRAVDLIAEGKFGQMVAWQDRRVVEVPIREVLVHHRSVDLKGSIVKTARGLGISLGD